MSEATPPRRPPRPSAGLVSALMQRAASTPELSGGRSRAMTTGGAPPAPVGARAAYPSPVGLDDSEFKRQISRRRAKSEHALQGVEDDMWQRDRELLRILCIEASEWLASLLSQKKTKKKTPKKSKKTQSHDEGEFQATEDPEALARALSTGVPLCRLIHVCLPDGDPIRSACSFTDGCEPGSFHARDNVHNFLTAAVALGVPNVVLFDVEDLMQGRHLKNVLNTLLQTAKGVAEAYGVTPPKIVKLEMDIDREGPVDEKTAVEDDVWPKKNSAVDKSIQAAIKSHKGLGEAVRVRHIKGRKGMYRVTGKKPPRRTLVVPIRSVRKVLMVRVGGGWEEFMSFIERRMGFVSPTLHREPL